MENLRWILLAAGIFFVLAIYFVGRQRRRNNSSDLFNTKEDLPEFTARDWDDLDEGVGEVRVVARENSETDFSEDLSVEPTSGRDDASDVLESGYDQEDDLQLNDDLFVLTEEVEPSTVANDEVDISIQTDPNIDIIVLYILAKSSDPLAGDKINSVAQANSLEFGRMNIFHRLDENGKTLFSMANMNEPGNFDPDSIHDLKTSGLTMFMQLSNLSNPSDDFDEMLRCAYHISEMLGASLCNQNRQPITQADAEYYRNLISEKENV